MFNRRETSLTTMIAVLLATTISAQTPQISERFTFTVPGAPESTVDGKGPLLLTLQRWSTDEEREKVLSTFKEGGSAKLLDAFRGSRVAGYLKWPGGLEYTVHYARQTTRPDGRTDVVLVIDRPVWVWWDNAKAQSLKPTDGPYSVVQMRLDKQGQGEGRVATATGVVADKDTGVALTDYDKQLALLQEVKRDRT